jgi:hypothetical protein
MVEMEAIMSPLPFDDTKRLPNPFGRIVGFPLDDNEVDVAEINRDAFETCQRLICEVLSQDSSSALTLFGDVGSGKTHLLGRVRRWIEKGSGALFVLVSMDTSARMLWRHLRRCLADALLRSDASGRRALDVLQRAPQAQIEQVSARDLGIVLGNLLTGAHLRDSAAWLRGQELPEAALQRLELAQPNPDEDQEAASRDVIVSLCGLLSPSVVVFCLDQIEALQSFPDDTEGLHAAGQAVWVLHDKVRNACIISCVQTSFVPVLEKILPEWVRDRMLGRRQGIRLLDWEQAGRLIAARLDSIPALAELRHGQSNPLWPLPEEPIRQVFVANAAPARKVITRCKDLFDQWRMVQAPAEQSLDDALQAMLEERIAPIEPADAEAAFRNGLPVVFRALAAPSTSPVKGSPVDFVLHNGRQVVALCNQANSNSLVNRIKKLETWLPGARPGAAQRLLIFRDARLPISPSAKVTQQRLKSIEENGGRFVSVSQEAIEALAALRRLLADAQSGDLAHRGDPIPVSTVEQWIAGHLPAALDPLIAEIGAPDLLSPKLADLLAQKKIVSVADAALELGVRPEEVESCARRDPRLFGILGGATAALFQPVQAEALYAD